MVPQRLETFEKAIKDVSDTGPWLRHVELSTKTFAVTTESQ